MDINDMLVAGPKAVSFIPSFEPLQMKESLGEGKNNIGFTIGENEDLIKANFEEAENEEIDWDLASKAIDILEEGIENYINESIKHKPVEESHDDEGFFFGYWFEDGDEDVLSFARKFAELSQDVDDSGEDEIFRLENIYDVIDNDTWSDIAKDVSDTCGEAYITVIESCSLSMIAPKDIE